MIESVDPITLPLWLIAAFAALQYPLGLMFGAECSLCCCRKCSGDECCGDEWPRPVGVCCDSIWHLDEGVCCDNVWHTDEGVCCNDEWQTGVGVCCDGHWITESGSCCRVKTVPLQFTASFGSGASGKIIRKGEGLPEVHLRTGGAGYALNVAGVVTVADVTVVVHPLSGGGATLSATVDDNPASGTFGEIVALSLDDAGDDYGTWQWLLRKHWFPDAEDGECCRDVWYPDVEPCQDGTVYLSIDDVSEDCCGCVYEQIYDPRVNNTVDITTVLDDLDCCYGTVDLPYYLNGDPSPCPQACCKPVGGAGEKVCELQTPDSCEDEGGESFPRSCAIGCPSGCCTEDSNGVSQCENVDGNNQCTGAVVWPSCATGCKGACCIDGVFADNLTQQECDSISGEWAGAGTVECQTGCREPFDETCCESVISTASGLTFTQPRRKRVPTINDTILVTVTGTTDSPVLIHGVPFGVNATPAKRCPINLSFHICWDKFNIEPYPCDTNFRRLDVTVCWEEVHTSIETLAFPTCSDTVVWLGNCSLTCVTTLAYSGSGVTSSNTIYTYGDAIIEANGVGALVIGTDIVPVSACNRTLTLSGSSTAVNEIGNIDQVLFTTTSLVKSGVGTWKLTESSTYGGTSVIKSGTLIVGVNTLPNAGAFGTGGGFVTLGDDSEYIAGSATLLLDAGITMGKWVRVPDVGVSSTQTVTIAGNAGAAFNDSTSWIYVGRDITLTSATGGTFEFRNKWTDYLGIAEPSVDITVGAAGLLGEVLVTNHLSTTGTIAVGYGRLHFGGGAGRAENVSAVIIDGDAAELEYTSSTPMYWPAVTLGPGSLLGTGVIADLSLASDPTIDAYATGSGEFQITGTLSGSGTLTKTGSGTLRISGTNTYLGEIDIDAGSVVVEQIVNGPGGLVSSATFTPSSLVVDFLDDPATGDEFQLLAGAVSQTYGSVTLTGTAATGTFNSATSTLTID